MDWSKVLASKPLCSSGSAEVELAPHVDPTSGKEQEVRIDLPNGFIFKNAQAIKTAVMKILSTSFNFDYSGRNAFLLWFSIKDHDGGTPMVRNRSVFQLIAGAR